MTRPTRGALLALLAALVLHLLTRSVEVAWLSLASGAALALPVAALLLRPRLGALEVTGSGVRARVGDTVAVTLTLTNTGTRPSPPLRLVESTQGLSPLVVAVPSLAPGGAVTASAVRTALARGVSERGTALLTSTAPFGLVRATRAVTPGGRTVVAPARTTARLPAAGGAGTGDRSSPEPGGGTEVLGLRPFRPGDSARAVSARASARHGRLVVLERERETGPALVLLCTATGQGQAWEQAVSTSCALAEQALASGSTVQLFGGGPPALRPDLAGVLDWHAGVSGPPAGSSTVAAAARAAGRGGALVVLAPDAASATAARAAGTAAGARTTVLGPA